ncbi:12617_t:CDS:2 [Funneliformis caledonium]|uniref:12617_t:CDS:1 n=1 Tax=Funneliformis caledonium TaxID=1117310 RepID=A0A9N9EWG1_9GLOM|nr:12617_t:CDS:2 [Funneliformis caledonium]
MTQILERYILLRDLLAWASLVVLIEKPDDSLNKAFVAQFVRPFWQTLAN